MPFHSVEKHGKELSQADEKLDFAELQKQKQNIFKEIEEGSLNLSRQQKTNLTSLTLSNSIKDGFELSKKLGLTPSDFTYALGKFVPFKQRAFIEKYISFVEQNKEFVVGRYDYFDENVIQPVRSQQLKKIEWWRKSYENINSAPYSDEINNYYKHFIRNRRVKNPELPKRGLAQVEITAEDHLISNEAMLKESYYTGPVRDFLGLETEDKLESSTTGPNGGSMQFRHFPEKYAWALRNNVIDKITLTELLHEMGFNEDESRKIIDTKLNKALYAPSKILFDERKIGSEKGLIEKIKQSLIKRGFKEGEFDVDYDDSSHEYQIKQKTGSTEVILKDEVGERVLDKVEDRPGLKFVQDVPKSINITLAGFSDGRHDLNLNWVDVVDGDTYSIYNEPPIYYGLIIKNGQIIFEGGHGETSVRKVGEDIAIFCGGAGRHERSRWSILKGNTIGRDWSAIEESGIEKIGESYYWVGVENNFGPGRDENKQGNYVILKDDVVEYSSHGLIAPPKLFNIDGKLCYINEWKVGMSRVFFDGHAVGEVFDEIKLCENSNDRLIFYARRGDECFVYIDGVEKKINLDVFGEDLHNMFFRDILLTDDGLFLIYSVDELYYSIHINSGFKYVEAKNISNISVIDGKIFYISGPDSDGYEYINWNPLTGVKVKANMMRSKKDVVGFNGRAYIVHGTNVVSIRSGSEESDPDLKEISFDGHVELVKSDGKLFFIESLQDKKRVWECDENGELKLNETEQRDLDLANAMAKEDLGAIKAYFDKYYPQEKDRPIQDKIKAEIKNMLQQSKGLVSAVNQTIKDMPELFMDTFRAKDDKPTEYLMTEMFNYMFPEAQKRREKAMEEKLANIKNPFRWGGGYGSGEGDVVNYDSDVNRLSSIDEDGYYEMMKANREVLRMREPLPSSTFITRSIFSNYDGKNWSKVNIPISQEVHDPAKETTFEFVDEKAGQNICLPKIANGKIISERIKGITSKDKEIDVKILEENVLGEVRVEKGREAKRLTYSMSYSEIPKTMAEVTQKDYEKFKKNFEKSFGDVMSKPLGDIGEELDVFVRGLKDKSPREQVIAIQEFCYEYGYYNLDNKPRDTDSFEDRLSIMEGRMDKLKELDPKLANKLYAGICTDFATLTTGLLRKAGFISGISTGFVPEAGSINIKTDRAHAVSYVLWPNPDNKDGKPDMIIVDGTPSSITPKIIEQEKKAEKMNKELTVDAEKELGELERILRTMDVGAIKNLENGKLEKTLNYILYGVKQSHVDVMGRVLNASRYAGFDILEMTRGNLTEQIEFRKFLEEEIYKEKNVTHDNRERRGEELFELMIDFTRRFEKDKNVKGKSEALDVLEKVFDIAERYLDPIEVRSSIAAITYLRAKKMR